MRLDDGGWNALCGVHRRERGVPVRRRAADRGNPPDVLDDGEIVDEPRGHAVRRGLARDQRHEVVADHGQRVEDVRRCECAVRLTAPRLHEQLRKDESGSPRDEHLLRQPASSGGPGRLRVCRRFVSDRHGRRLVRREGSHEAVTHVEGDEHRPGARVQPPACCLPDDSLDAGPSFRRRRIRDVDEDAVPHDPERRRRRRPLREGTAKALAQLAGDRLRAVHPQLTRDRLHVVLRGIRAVYRHESEPRLGGIGRPREPERFAEAGQRAVEADRVELEVGLQHRGGGGEATGERLPQLVRARRRVPGASRPTGCGSPELQPACRPQRPCDLPREGVLDVRELPLEAAVRRLEQGDLCGRMVERLALFCVLGTLEWLVERAGRIGEQTAEPVRVRARPRRTG